MTTVHLDFETRSTVDLRRAGVHRYAEDPTTEIICLRYKIDNNPIGSWLFGEPMPDDLIYAISQGAECIAHNAAFERLIWNAKAPTPMRIRPSDQSCTMARAQVVGLPGRLEALAKAIRLPASKDMEGHRLMLKMCKPRTLDPLTWHETPEQIERLSGYCGQDVVVEECADTRLPKLKEFERRVWELDQTINDRGVQLDMDMVRTASACVKLATARANRRIWRLTNGDISTVNQVGKLVNWINKQGVPCDSLRKGEKRDEIIVGAEVFDHPEVLEAVNLRASSAKAFKFKAMEEQVCRDGRVRGSLRYAATLQRRWAGAGVQFHNMKRVETDEDAHDVSLAVKLLTSGRPAEEILNEIEILFDSPLDILSLCTRASIIARRLCKLIGGDFSNIEGRICAWLSGHTEKLAAFRRYDRGEGPDLYRVTAGEIIGIPPEQVTREQRQEQGKVPELACQFQGALGAFKKMGAKYGVRLSDARVAEIVRGWRLANLPIQSSWYDLQDAAIQAVSARGVVVPALNDKVRYVADKAFLYCRLPSGGVIHYPSPSVAWKTKTVIIDDDPVELNRLTVSYWTGEGGRWVQEDLYGGRQCAHIVSGLARDVLCDTMLRAEARGFPIVLTVHDEILAEAPIDSVASAKALKEVMEEPIPWMGDCPLTASTWEGDRYVK